MSSDKKTKQSTIPLQEDPKTLLKTYVYLKRDQGSSKKNTKKFPNEIPEVKNSNSRGTSHRKKWLTSQPKAPQSFKVFTAKYTPGRHYELKNNSSIVEYRTQRAQDYAERQKMSNRDSFSKSKQKNETFHPVIDPRKHGRSETVSSISNPPHWSSKGEGVFVEENHTKIEFFEVEER